MAEALTPGQIVLDLTIVVPALMCVYDSHAIELRVRDHIMSARTDIREIKVHVHADAEEKEAAPPTPPTPASVNSDFTKHGCDPWEGTK